MKDKEILKNLCCYDTRKMKKKYKYVKGKFLKYGHTMLEQDVVKDLDRLVFLEGEYLKYKASQEMYGILLKFKTLSSLWLPVEASAEHIGEAQALHTLFCAMKKAIKKAEGKDD